MKQFLTFVLLGLMAAFSLEAQPFQYFPNVHPTSGRPTSDGGYVLGGDTLLPNGNTRGYIRKMDVFGNTQWIRDFGFTTATDITTADVQQTSLGFYVAPTTTAGWTNQDMAGVYYFREDGSGKGFLFNSTNNLNYRVTAALETHPGRWHLAGDQTSTSPGSRPDFWLRWHGENSATANKSQAYIGAQEVRDLLPAPNKGAYMLVYSQNDPLWATSTFVVQADSNNNFISYPVVTIQNGLRRSPRKMIQLPNSHFVIIGEQRDSSMNHWEGYMMEVDQNKNIVWDKSYTAGSGNSTFLRDFRQLPNGDFMVLGHEENTKGLYLMRTTVTGDTIWTKSLAGILPNTQEEAISLSPYLYGGFSLLAADTDNDGAVRVLADSNGVVITSLLQGTVYSDLNQDCVFGATEDSLGKLPFLLRILETGTGDTIGYASTKTDGSWQAFLPTGSYEVEPIYPHPYLSYPCPSLGAFVLSQPDDTVTANVPVHINYACPLNYVDIHAPILRYGDTNQVFVQVCNLGTAHSYPTQVEVVLDPYLQYVSSTLQPASQTGQTLTFDLDSLDIGACQQIKILAWLDTMALQGETHCLEASVTPDSLCVAPAWAGPVILANGSCVGDSIFFEVENVGNSMSLPQGYTIYIDDVIFSVGSFQLNQTESEEIHLAADSGATYRIEADQAPGFPALLGDTVAIAFVEGCLPFADGSFNTAWITAYYNGNSSPFHAISCQQNVFAFDPNDKQAQPVGYGPDKLIQPQTPLDYQIRFQNTGTDTAFKVVLVDTLTQLLDLSTLHMGASSHPYTWSISKHGILRVVFNPIALPDSGVNMIESNGFVRFRIEPKAGLAIGTQIHNAADIYFDYNEAVRTNETTHQIGVDYVPNLALSAEFEQPGISILLYPNPFKGNAMLEIQGAQYQHLHFLMTDLQGRKVYEQSGEHTSSLSLSPGKLAPGIYLYQVMGDGRMIGSGKIRVE